MEKLKETNIFLYILLFFQVHVQCVISLDACKICLCEPTIYGLDYLHVDCSHLDLLNIPDEFPKTMRTLDLSHNQLTNTDFNLDPYPITSIDLSYNDLGRSQRFFSSPRILHITVTGNVFSNLSADAFSRLPSLRSIVGLHMADFPRTLFENMTWLQQLHVEFDSPGVDAGIFAELNELLDLSITCHQMTNISEDFFYFGKDSLRSLYFHSRSLESLPDTIFMALSLLEILVIVAPSIDSLPGNLLFRPNHDLNTLPLNLKSVQISGIGNLPENLFHKQQRLENLQLNGLVHLPAGLLDCVTLDHLDLHGSNLTSIERKSFQKLQSLKYLNLNNTFLTVIDSETFFGLDSLVVLTLVSNQLVQLKENTFDHVKNLEVLNLADNNLHKVEPKLFQNLRALKVLDLSQNQLGDLDSEVFSALRKLRDLNLSQNRLSSIPNKLLDLQLDLVKVNMSHNNLSSFPDVFGNAKIMRTLDVSHNGIRDIALNFFCNKHDLEELYLRGNPINCDCDIAQLNYELPRLRTHGECASPEEYRGKRIREVLDVQLTCQLQVMQAMCYNKLVAQTSTSTVSITTNTVITTLRITTLNPTLSVHPIDQTSTRITPTTGVSTAHNISKNTGTNRDRNKVLSQGGSTFNALYVALAVFGTIVLVGSGMSVWYRARQRRRRASYEVNPTDRRGNRKYREPHVQRSVQATQESDYV